jgi:thiol-disulfide isomerase/thioredoxin
MLTGRRTLAALLVPIAAAVAAGAAGGPDIKLVSQGREVVLEEHLVPGKLVVFDFYADWCAPCRYLTPQLERLAAAHPERFALRKIDVIDWESPVARQHRISSLPHLVLFGADGSRLADGDANRVLQMLGSELGLEATGGRHAAGGGVPTPVWLALVAALGLGSFALLRRGREPEAAPRGQPGTAPAAEPDASRIWLVMTGQGLQGPFTVGELAALVAAGTADGDSRVRRRGDGSWRRLGDLIPTA